MILEAFILNVKAGTEAEFEAALRESAPLIRQSPGYISHEVQRCLETPGRYIFLAHWRTLEDHTVGFRTSPQFAQWKALLHHFYESSPTVQHFQPVDLGQ